MKVLFFIFLFMVIMVALSVDHKPERGVNCKGFTLYQKGIASWYGDYFDGRRMSNGKPFDMNAYTVAHREIPNGTMVCIVNPKNKKAVIAVVTDWGPKPKGRIIDLSKRIATELQIGLGPVEVYR